MPRRRRRSTSPGEQFTPDDEDDYLNNDDASQNSNDRCPPQQRNAANARERARMRVLSKAFCRLKTTLPWVPADTKLSKLDTLRLASGYIAHLRALLADQPAEEVQHAGRPLNLTWPFTFQQGVGAAWVGPDRGTPPRGALSPQQPTSVQVNQHHVSGCDPAMYNNNNFFTRTQSYSQTDNNNYYNQIHRDNFLRHPYNESMLHTG